MGDISRTFDLQGSSERSYRFHLVDRIVILGIGGGFFIFWLFLLLRLLGRIGADLGSGNTSDLALQLAFFLVGPLILGSCLYLEVYRLRRGPTGLKISDQDLEFTFLSRDSSSIRWDDPRFDLVIRDNRSNTNVHRLLAVDIFLPRVGYVPIPPDALDSILTHAGGHGLAIHEGKGRDEFERIGGTKIIRIRQP